MKITKLHILQLGNVYSFYPTTLIGFGILLSSKRVCALAAGSPLSALTSGFFLVSFSNMARVSLSCGLKCAHNGPFNEPISCVIGGFILLNRSKHIWYKCRAKDVTRLKLEIFITLVTFCVDFYAFFSFVHGKLLFNAYTSAISLGSFWRLQFLLDHFQTRWGYFHPKTWNENGHESSASLNMCEMNQ